MFTNRARIFVVGAFIIMLAVSVNLRVYEIAAVIVMFIFLLIWGYFKEGTIVLAAKAFHNKDYDKAESLLLQVNNPDWLSKNGEAFMNLFSVVFACKGRITLKPKNITK